MLNKKLIELVNSGDCWALIGSGPSCLAGLPSWAKLVIKTYEIVQKDRGKMTDEKVSKFSAKHIKGNYQACFSLLNQHYGKDKIDQIVCRQLSLATQPSNLHTIVAKWPFKGYATTNYDKLIELSLKNFPGWTPVGNSQPQNRLISKGIDKIIWHPHGLCDDPDSLLVLSSEDYDQLYADGSSTSSALTSLIRMFNFVIIGFGFSDYDLKVLLNKVGRTAALDMPIYAFISDVNNDKIEEFKSQYNVELLPYDRDEDDHSDLSKVLEAYNAFIATRDLRFNCNISHTPEYDEVATSLLVENKLSSVLSDAIKDKESILVRAYIIAEINTSNAIMQNVLFDKMREKLNVTPDEFDQYIEKLIFSQKVKKENNELSLTKESLDSIDVSKVNWELIKSQYISSVRAIALTICDKRGVVDVDNVVRVVSVYIEETCRNRGLGIAQLLSSPTGDFNRARMVSLLQHLHEHLVYCANRGEADAVINIVCEIYSSPPDEIKRYFGYLTQAYFGKHLVGCNQNTLAIKKDLIANTVFLLDSNVLVPLLAVNCVGYKYAMDILSKLKALHVKTITTDGIAKEALEHASWAWDKLNACNGFQENILKLVKCENGERSNEFVNGFVFGPGPSSSIKSYFDLCLKSGSNRPNIKGLTNKLTSLGITVINPVSIDLSREAEFLHERTEVAKLIKKIRDKKATFKHDKQVENEAEVAMLLDGFRAGTYKVSGENTLSQYFLSHSRVIDNLASYPGCKTMHPAAVIYWANSLSPVSEDEAIAIFDQLLWELLEANTDLVPRNKLLQLFGPVLEATSDSIQKLVLEHRELIESKFSSNFTRAFSDTDPLQYPSLLIKVQSMVADKLRDQVKKQQVQIDTLKKEQKISKSEKEKLDKLEQKQKEKRAKQTRKKRAALSKKKK